MHIPTFKMPTHRQVLQLIQQGDYVFSIHPKTYLDIPIYKYHFLYFVWQNKPYQWKVLLFGLATTPRVFISFTKTILFVY